MVNESAWDPARDELPTDICEGLERRIASGGLELPLLPHVAGQVLAMSTADEVSARTLAELLHRDQAIAAHVLRIANSPLYRPRVPIVSLQQAVSRLGITTLREIITTVSLQSRVFNVPAYAAEAREVWHHAMHTAAYAREIARRCRRNVEGAFLGGLLHDVGKPVLLLALADMRTQFGKSLTPTVVTTALEVYHVETGALLASTWKLPAEVCESIVYHHDPHAAPTYPESVMVTCLADRVASELGQPEVDMECLCHDPLWTQLNLYPDDVDALLAEHQMIVQFAQAMG